MFHLCFTHALLIGFCAHDEAVIYYAGCKQRHEKMIPKMYMLNCSGFAQQAWFSVGSV